MITAPYNFVPLNEKVYIPYWSKLVSHDIPFKDGESGEIDITITAKSPIFIRDSKNKEEFSQHNGEYFIPGSSIKGMIRNVLEIMSFSKLRNEVFNDNTYAVRDLSKGKNFYLSKMNQIDNTTFCGWLKKVDDKYFIENCGKPGRIHHKQIDYALGIEFSKYFTATDKKFKVDDNNQKTSKYKYSLVGDKFHTISLSDKYFSETNPKYDKREFYKFDKNGKNKAVLVLTGQPTSRQNTGKQGDGKGFEFLFFDSKGDIEVSKDIVEKFKFAYFDKRTTEPKESPDWTYWKTKLSDGEKIPVFFQIDDNKKVEHFGLSYLYKLPYKYSTKHGVNSVHFEDALDLTQTIFGYVSKNNNDALKGRVSFSHFKAVSNVKELHPRTEILGTPRASYYPNYVRQNRDDEYSTYMNGDFKISGRKRYPIHKNGVEKTLDTGNANVGTKFKPLDSGVVFKGKVRFHNLKKLEIGALLSSLLFHDTNGCFHSIGLAKSLGYGKISLSVDNVDNIDEYLREFELNISSQIENWSSSREIQELLTMATEQDNKNDSKLEYMKLEEFASNKTKIEHLKMYSELTNIKVKNLVSKLKEDDKAQVQKIFEDDRKIIEDIKLKEKEIAQMNKDWEIAKISNNIELLKNFVSKYPDALEKIEIAQNLIVEIKQKEEQQKRLEAEKEANEKWEAIQKIDAKYKQKALEDFISNYPNSPKVEQAKKELETLGSKTTNTSSANLDDLKNAKDAKKVKAILEKIPNINENQKNEIVTITKELYLNMKAKDQKNFFKDAQLGRFLGSDLENQLKKDLGI